MTSEAGSAWTLVISYALRNRLLGQFGLKGALENDAPVNEHSCFRKHTLLELLTCCKATTSKFIQKLFLGICSLERDHSEALDC